MSDNYPIGARYDKDAPYNEESKPEIEVEVNISVTLSKTVKVTVNDYTETDNYYDISEDTLVDAVSEQVGLPQDAFSDWTVDDFIVTEE